MEPPSAAARALAASLLSRMRQRACLGFSSLVPVLYSPAHFLGQTALHFLPPSTMCGAPSPIHEYLDDQFHHHTRAILTTHMIGYACEWVMRVLVSESDVCVCVCVCVWTGSF
jgi:hypothetical protein